jgi:hypothetical protein
MATLPHLSAFAGQNTALAFTLGAVPDIPKARQSCQRFIAEMSSNRKGYDDAGVARRILEDLASFGDATPKNRRRLSFWCHTNGTIFKRGIPLAREISIALYGRIIPRED